jgi:4-hydroxy-3-methylbut-2-enyl diphosphate reductase
VERLQAEGITILDGDRSRFGAKDCILIRSHGATPARRKELSKMGCNVVDCTCPAVRRNENLIAKLLGNGKHVLLFGKKTHPEIVALAACDAKNISVCEGEVDLPSTDAIGPKDIAILCQTTADGHEFSKFVAAAKLRFPMAQSANGQCGEVKLRCEELAKAISRREPDTAVIVVGSQHSSNAQTLAAIGHRASLKTAICEKICDIGQDFFCGTKRIAIASATSTPADAVDAITSHCSRQRGQRIADGSC